MFSLATTKPGDKYRSIKNPAVYEALRRQGMSKQRAARISNAQSHKDAGTVAGAPLHGPGGMLATPGLGAPRKRKGKRWGQRLKCTCGVALKAATGQPGELLAPGVRRIRGNLCNVHGRYGPCDTGAAGKPKKGRAAKKPPKAAKPKQTPEQRATARDAERQQNADAVAKRMQDSDTGLSPSGVAAMRGLASGAQPDKARGDGLVKMGLAELGSDGSYRMSATGRAAMNAMSAGDYQRAVDTIARAGDTAAARRGRQGAAATRQQEAATRRQAVQTRREQAQRQRAERAQQAGKKKPSSGGKRSAGSGATEATQAAPRATQPAKRRPSSASAPSGPSVGGGAKPKPKAPKPEKPTKEQQQAGNRASVRDAMAQADQGLAPGGFDNLIALGAGTEPNDIGAKGLISMGMAERGSDGTLRLTSAGRQAIAAADRGDAKAAIDVISRASEPKTTKAETYGGVKRSKLDDSVFAGPDRSFPIKTAQDVRDAVMSLGRTKHDKAVVKRGIIRRAKAIGAMDALPESWRASTKDDYPDQSQFAGYTMEDWDHDRPAKQPSKASVEAARQQFAKALGVDTVAQKAFIVFKDHTGAHRWLARTTTAYRDRDQEIISSDALDQDSQRMTAIGAFGPLRYWHVGQPDPLDVAQPWGPGLDIGDCDYSMLIGRTRVESGTFRDPQIAQKVAQQADRYELSPGFFHPLDQPDAGGVFHAIRTFERSIVPTAYGRASNLFTGLAVKEQRMDVNEMEKRFKTAIADLGLNAEQAQALGMQLVQTEKDAGAMIDPITRQPGIAYKSDDVQPVVEDYPDIIVNGVTYKAAPPPMEMAAVEDVEDVAVEEPAEEAMTGEYIGDMSWDEFAAKLTELLAPVLKMQDMHKGMTDALGEMKAMYGGVATKDDARAQELVTLKTQYADLAAKIAQIEGDQPATILPDEVAAALKSAGPATPPKPEDPAKQAALSDPARPFAWLGMQTFPELYQNGENS